MITVKVYGSLKRIMGNKKIHNFTNCHNIRQLITAIEVNYKGFAKYLSDNAANPFFILVNKKTSISKENILMQNFKDGDEVKIVPVTVGSGDSWGSVLSIIVGIIIIWATYGVAGWETVGMGMGMSMIMSGVSQLLFKPQVQNPSTYEPTDPKTAMSYAFSGPLNVTAQGNPVPLGYGRLRIGSQVVGAGIFSQNI